MLELKRPETAAVEFGRVAVLFGGWSAEREVSLSSGKQVLDALQSAGVDAFGVDVDRAELYSSLHGRCDRVFNVLHGTWGEDGNLQGFLDTLGIPYTGSTALGSSLAMNKHLTKLVCRQLSIETPRWGLADNVDECLRLSAEVGYPCVVKPVSEGSSIGVSIVQANEVQSAYERASRYGMVMVEQYIRGSEITAAIIGRQALPLVRISTPREFYDYEAKYQENTTVYDCPADLSETLGGDIQAAALSIFEAIQGRGWGRVDFLLNESNQFSLLEINTVPGMTSHSLVPMAAKQVGLDFQSLVLTILAQTLDQ